MIDGQTVITGSFNFTKSAEENNAENLLVIRSPELAEKYTANWQAHAEHSEPYTVRQRDTRRRIGPSPPHPTSPATTPVPATDGYVASRNSAVFHRPDCKSAAKISPKNLVHYATRDEAIAAGRNRVRSAIRKKKSSHIFLRLETVMPTKEPMFSRQEQAVVYLVSRHWDDIPDSRGKELAMIQMRFPDASMVEKGKAAGTGHDEAIEFEYALVRSTTSRLPTGKR